MVWQVVTRLLGPRVVLRPLEPADGDAWREVRRRNRDWLEPWEPRPEPGSPDLLRDHGAFRARCASAARQRHLDTAHPLGIFLHDGGLVGEINLSGIQRGPFQSAHVGYWIDQAQAGRGLVPEALVLVLRLAFEELSLHRVEIAIVPRNRASRRVVEKLGLREEGIAREYLQIRGRWEDHVRYGITADEWAERRDELAARFLARSRV
jgi:[ribosomal protein S5]-alanine N-acetyltransferase